MLEIRIVDRKSPRVIAQSNEQFVNIKNFVDNTTTGGLQPSETPFDPGFDSRTKKFIVYYTIIGDGEVVEG